jgi:hypothetical protein
VPRLLAPLLFATLVAATLLAFVLVERERDRARLVDAVTVTRAFDPDGGAGESSARLRFRLTREEPDADVLVVDEAGEVVSTLIEDRALGDFEFHDFRWHGERDEGGNAPPGIYRFRLDLAELDRVITIPDQIEVVISDPAPGSA